MQIKIYSTIHGQLTMQAIDNNKKYVLDVDNITEALEHIIEREYYEIEEKTSRQRYDRLKIKLNNYI